jgi:hypothetical protein
LSSSNLRSHGVLASLTFHTKPIFSNSSLMQEIEKLGVSHSERRNTTDKSKMLTSFLASYSTTTHSGTFYTVSVHYSQTSPMMYGVQTSRVHYNFQIVSCTLLTVESTLETHGELHVNSI